MNSNVDDYGSVSIETAANDVAKIFVWALLIKMFTSIFVWLWNAASGVAKKIWNWFVGSNGFSSMMAT